MFYNMAQIQLILRQKPLINTELSFDINLLIKSIRILVPPTEKKHRRTGLEIFGGGHESTRIAPKAREPLGVPAACSPRNFEK